jgi:VanZ family protein
MALLRRHKYILLSLGLYWPVLFIATHIRLPNLTETTGMSDKTMHVLAYGILVFLLFLSISPYRRVNWKKVLPWLLVAAVAGYGAMDEWLQGKVGRTPDLGDLLADIGGILGALLILTVLDFWPASMAICGITVFSLANLSLIASKPNLAWLNMVNTFSGYAVFTLIWIQYSQRVWPSRTSGTISWAASMMGPGLLLLILVRAYGVVVEGKSLQAIENYAALLSIVAAVVVSAAVLRWGPKPPCRPQTADTADRRSKASARS